MTPTVSVVIPVKDGGALPRGGARRGRARRARVELLVIDSGSRDGSRGDRPRRRRRGDRDRAGGVRPRPHAQPRRRAHARRADLLPHPGRDAGRRLARRATARRSRSTSASARRSARTCPRPDTSPMIARELTEFFAGVRARRAARRSSGAGDPTVPLERQRVLPRGRAGRRSASPTCRTRGPGVRARDARGRLGEGLPPGRGRAARARLRAARVHAPLLRRVPRAARDERARRAARAARSARRPRRSCARRALDARAGLSAGASGRAGCRARRRTTPAARVFSALGSRADAAARPRAARALARGRAAARRPAPPRA